MFQEILNLNAQKNIVVNLIGPPGSGKSLVCYNYAAQVLNKRQPVVFVALANPPEQVISGILRLTDVDTQTLNNLLTIIDGYSPTVGLKPKIRLSSNSLNPTDFSLTLSSALEKEVECVVIDPLSTFLIHNKEELVIRVLQIIMAKLRNAASYSFITYEEGVHSQVLYNTFRFLGDINIILRRDETERGESIRSMHVQSSKGMALDEQWHQLLFDQSGRIMWNPSLTNKQKSKS